MSGPWRVRPMRRDGVVVWVVYRLADPARPDQHDNRVYWPNGMMGWCARQENAESYARGLNAMAKV